MVNSGSSINTRGFNCVQNILFSVTRFFQRLVLRKDIHSLDADSHSEHRLRPRALKLFHLVGIGLGGTIGTGIFVFTGHAAGLYAGPSVIIAFILAGIVALLAAFSYSELASIIITPGSAYTYAYVVLGEYAAFLIGWLSAFPYQFGASVAVVRWSRYVAHLTYVVSNHNATDWLVNSPFIWSETQNSFIRTGQVLNLPAIAITLFITVLLIWGVRETATTIFVLVIVKLVALLIFILAGCIHVDKKNYVPFVPSNLGTFNQFGFTGMLRASTYVFYAYIAFETVAIASKESKKPTQYIPYAMITSLVISTLMYLGISTVMVGLVHYTHLNIDIPMYAAVKATNYGLWFSVVMDLGAIASLTTVATTILYAQTRIFFTMARDGLLPKMFTRVHEGRKTPWLITLVCGSVCAIMSGFFPVDILGEIASIGALITFLVVHVCVIVLRYKHKDVVRDFKGTFNAYPWLIPGVGALLCILLLIPVSRATGIRFGIWMGIGHLVYFGYGFRHSKERKALLSQNNNSTADLVSVIDLSRGNSMAPPTPVVGPHPPHSGDEPSTPPTVDEGMASSNSESDQSSTPEEEHEASPPIALTVLGSIVSVDRERALTVWL